MAEYNSGIPFRRDNTLYAVLHNDENSQYYMLATFNSSGLDYFIITVFPTQRELHFNLVAGWNMISRNIIPNQEFWSDESANWFVITTTDESILSIVASQIAGKYPSLREVIPVDYYAEVIESSLKTTTIFFQLLIFYTFLLSGLAQFLSILMTILRMQREMGIMRSIGLPQKAVLQIFSIESILLGSTGVIFGIINGIIGSDLLTWYISFSIPIQARFNLQIILFWSFVSLVITVACSEITTRRTMNTIIADALSGESLFKLKTKKDVHREWGTYLEEQGLRKIEVKKVELVISREEEKQDNR